MVGGVANIKQQTIDVINPTSDKTLTFPYQDSQNTPIKFKVLLVAEKNSPTKKLSLV
ncbi:MAG TPA: hypothetical protein ACHBX0_03915 [Arsenophonus sp.]